MSGFKNLGHITSRKQSGLCPSRQLSLPWSLENVGPFPFMAMQLDLSESSACILVEPMRTTQLISLFDLDS